MNEHHLLYDKILMELPKDGSQSNPGDLDTVDLIYLESCGYVDLTMTSSGSVFLFSLTPIGMKFISEGGFTEQDRKDNVAERDAEMQRKNWETTTKAAKQATLISWLSLAVSIVAATLALIAMI